MGNKNSGRKTKQITWRVNENSCWICTSHIPGKGNYPLGHKNKKPTLISHIMYEKYKGVIPFGLWVLHTCDNKLCINPDHLWLGTRTDNVRDMFSKGRQRPLSCLVRGERVSNHKLTERQVKEIRLLNLPQRKIAKLYCVSQGTIGKIKRNTIWKHVT